MQKVNNSLFCPLDFNADHQNHLKVHRWGNIQQVPPALQGHNGHRALGSTSVFRANRCSRRGVGEGDSDVPTSNVRRSPKAMASGISGVRVAGSREPCEKVPMTRLTNMNQHDTTPSSSTLQPQNFGQPLATAPTPLALGSAMGSPDREK